jgi:hypothetical protein
MAAQGDAQTMVSEQIAPGMLPRVLNSFDMTIVLAAVLIYGVSEYTRRREFPTATPTPAA